MGHRPVHTNNSNTPTMANVASELVSQIGNFVNTTLSASTYDASSFASALKADSIPNDLYAGYDWDALSIAEKWWVQWYMKIGDPVLATGIMSFLLHELFYFGRCIPWMIIDSMPYFRKWKLQDTKAPTRAEQWKCTKYVLLTHFTVELPQIWGFHPLAEYFGADHHDHHHQFFIGNYSTSFRIWDYVFGTEGSYRLTRQKQRDEKKAAKEALRLKKEG